MSTIAEIENEIVEDFELFEDWEGKYDYLIGLGKDLPLIHAMYKTDEYLVRGCQSRVWLHASHEGDRVFYTADSDAIITKGLVALMVKVLNGQKAEDIVKAELGFIDKIGLKEHLSPNRSNGLASMIKQMKLYAIAMGEKK
jgi:cysteine desulfuration protein SufE